MILSIIEIHVAELRNVEIAEIVSPELKPGNIPCPVWSGVSFKKNKLLFHNSIKA